MRSQTRPHIDHDTAPTFDDSDWHWRLAYGTIRPDGRPGARSESCPGMASREIVLHALKQFLRGLTTLSRHWADRHTRN